MQASALRYVAFNSGLLFRNPSRYLGLQLKFLYVAITRARNNLWIVDSSDSAEPMKVPATLVVPEKVSHSSRRYTGAARTRSRSGRLLQRHRVWRSHLLLKNGQKPGERQY